ncbi:MAG: hypothetical protein AAF250_15310 [Pseudomonadota bacterium]
MANISDIDERIEEMREWILKDNGVASGIRTFDAVSELFGEVIRELRDANEHLAVIRSQTNDD